MIDRLRRAAFALLAAALSATAVAHEVRPAYLALQETAPGEFAVLFKTPRLGERTLALQPEFGAATQALTPVVTRTTPDALVREWTLAAGGLRGTTVAIAGLETTMTDALVRIDFLDGTSFAARLTPAAPSAAIPAEQGALEVVRAYTQLGVEHILSGVDHLLFVLALLIVAGGGWRVVATVTAFTAAHSMTLALATLGVLRVPAGPVEACIALSIAFVAAEIVHGQRGEAPGLTARAPWAIAFAFGLLHGLGFAGALAAIGLPQGQVPLALFSFNLGVELGQLAFILAVLALVEAARRLPALAAPRASRWAAALPPYAIGTIAMYWVVQRIATF